MPFVDIGIKDANWKAIQMVGISGVIKAEETNGKLLFNGEKLIRTVDIKEVVKDHYYKAQIWFDDYKNEVITIGAALDMICYVGNKAPESTLKEVEKNGKLLMLLLQNLRQNDKFQEENLPYYYKIICLHLT